MVKGKAGLACLTGGGRFFRTLSGRFLMLTVAFVMLAEVLIFLPSIARFLYDSLVERLKMAQRVRRVMARLPDKDRFLIERYYYHEQTLELVGASMGLSKSWTSRLHARALALLREELDAESSGKYD